jgi:hypothetical protein
MMINILRDDSIHATVTVLQHLFAAFYLAYQSTTHSPLLTVYILKMYLTVSAELTSP